MEFDPQVWYWVVVIGLGTSIFYAVFFYFLRMGQESPKKRETPMPLLQLGRRVQVNREEVQKLIYEEYKSDK